MTEAPFKIAMQEGLTHKGGLPTIDLIYTLPDGSAVFWMRTGEVRTFRPTTEITQEELECL